MNTRYRRVAVFVGTAALAAGAGIGVASKGAATPSATPNTTQQQQGPGGAPGAGGLDVSSLADALGVSEARLEEAMRNARPTDRSAGGGPDDMFQALADELGVSVDKVREAFESTMPQGGGGGAPPTDSQTT
jgi:hypothetical protein